MAESDVLSGKGNVVHLVRSHGFSKHSRWRLQRTLYITVVSAHLEQFRFNTRGLVMIRPLTLSTLFTLLLIVPTTFPATCGFRCPWTRS